MRISLETSKRSLVPKQCSGEKMSGGEVLDRLLPCLRQYLSLDHVRVYLMEKGLLTRDEYEQLFSMRNELGSVQVNKSGRGYNDAMR